LGVGSFFLPTYRTELTRVNVSPPSPHPTAGVIAIFTLALLSAVALVSFHDRGPQWDVAVVTISTLVVCPLILASRGSRRRDTDEAPGARTEPPQAPAIEDADTSSWPQRVLTFAMEMRGSLSTDRLYEIIARTLPTLAGVDQIWIETEIGHRRLLTAPPGGDAAPANPLWAAPGEWATFPLQAGDAVVGVLGVQIAQRPLSVSTRRTLEAVAPLIGESLHIAHTIAHLRELSTIDPVTGCGTRHDGLEKLRAELKRAQRASQEVAILMLDLDYFKSINDRYGHQCGDSVLAAIGRTIMQTLRVSDVRCRWGGEEFLVALPESGLEQAMRVAVTLARRIAGTVTEYDSARIQLTTSVGITIATSGEEDSDTVLARADAALYRAKTDGRNCIRIMLADVGAVATAPASPAPLPFRDRRDPHHSDRREHPGPGRRTTDSAHAGRPAPAGTSAVDDAQVDATPV
jgi:diguanylate cyclase (GGDEF)-like protein